MKANNIIATENKCNKEESISIPLLVSGKLNATCEATKQEYCLIFAGKVEYDENGGNPVVWYKTTAKRNTTTYG